MKRFLWKLTMIGSVLGGVMVVYGWLFTGTGFVSRDWVEQAAVTTVGIAFAVIPYCLASAASEMAK
jgi:magnesium-transporting ATPase (P-type)